MPVLIDDNTNEFFSFTIPVAIIISNISKKPRNMPGFINTVLVTLFVKKIILNARVSGYSSTIQKTSVYIFSRYYPLGAVTRQTHWTKGWTGSCTVTGWLLWEKKQGTSAIKLSWQVASLPWSCLCCDVFQVYRIAAINLNMLRGHHAF